MPYFAAALARTGQKWVGRELDLRDVDDLDALADLVRAVTGDEPPEPGLLFIEEDDEWLGVLRVDGDEDPRVFISDSRMVDTSDIARMLYEEAAEADVLDADEDDEDEEDEESIRPAAEPAGDTDILADLGTSSRDLLGLCAEEGQLPADVISALCEKAGCVEELERLREG